MKKVLVATGVSAYGALLVWQHETLWSMVGQVLDKVGGWF